MSNTDLKARAEILVPDFARDNYDQMARDIAAQEGISPKEAMGRLVAGWKQQHQQKPLDGFDVLAAWGEDRDPGDGTANPAAAALTRAVESAKREPQQALDAHPDVQAAAEAALADRASADLPDSTVRNAGPANLAAGTVEASPAETSDDDEHDTAAPAPAPRTRRR